MHIPDGYLSPASAGALYVAATPFWAIAAARTGRILRGRTVPLLAIFSAFTFAIMMFNVPVPGGTTAHAVGGTLTAIVLGPWASVISTSVALVIQALFFGDGGITAIGANCFNMAVMLPLSGYAVYRLVAGRSGALSSRRVIAAAIGAYVGITVAALLVALQLGIQPRLWSTNGVPDYSPYGFSSAIPAMLVAHMLGASFVEAAVTALGLAYLQKTYPELLGRGRGRTSDQEMVEETVVPVRAGNPWVPVLAVVAVAAAIVVIAGLIKSHGDLQTWAGITWSDVDWAAAGGTVLVSVLVSAVVLPLLYLGLRRAPGLRTVAMLFVALIIWAPIGLIAPGGAFAEDASATREEVTAALQALQAGDASKFDALPDVNKECRCVPNNINDVGFAGKTLFSGYQPPWVNVDSDPAWKQNLGYQAAGFIGMALLGGIAFGLWKGARWLAPADPADWRRAEP